MERRRDGRRARDEVSIRRTDLCAFERNPHRPRICAFSWFQSVERICVPSNAGLRESSVGP